MRGGSNSCCLPRLRIALTIALASGPQLAAADGIVRPIADTGILKLSGSAWQGNQLIWLLCLVGAIVAAIALATKIDPTAEPVAARESGLTAPALILPAAMIVLVLEFLLWGLLESGVGVIASAVFGILLGIASIQSGLKQLVLQMERRLAHGPLVTPHFHAAIRTIFECGSVALLLFLTAFVPYECSAFVVLTFTMGQILVARLGAVERDNFGTAAGGDVFQETISLSVRQNVVLVAFAFAADVTFSAFTMASAEMTVWLLVVRVLQPLGILFSEWWVTASVTAKLGEGNRRELSTWLNGVTSFVILFGAALLILRLLRADGFWIHHHFWWLIALVAGMGLGVRLLLIEAGLVFGEWMQRNQPGDGNRALLILNVMRSGEGFALLIAMLISIALFQTEPLQIFLTDTPEYTSWVLAMTLFAFGYNLGDGLNCPDTIIADQALADPAPRYDIELLALAGAAVLLLTVAFDNPVKHFSLVHSKVGIGIITGILLHGFVFPFTLAMPAAGTSNSDRDRTIMNVRRIHGFLAVFFMQLGLALGLAFFSVFAFTTAVFVMAIMDAYVAPGKKPEERFNLHSWLCFSIVAVAVATEFIRALNENGLEFLTLFGGLGEMLGSAGNLSWLRYLIGTLSIAGGVGIGVLLHLRGINYRPPKAEE